MENNDIPMPSPPDRIRALLAEALVRSDMQAAASARLAGLLKDAPASQDAVKQKLYAVLLTDSRVSNKVGNALRRSCGCTAVMPVGNGSWIVEAPDGLQSDMRDKLNDAVERHYSVFVLELGENLAWAYQDKDKCVHDVLVKYLS